MLYIAIYVSNVTACKYIKKVFDLIIEINKI